ncbi:MAG TPA: VOC family protein [Candidatus Doudnabacteria bacterium]|nr:VOC family protein [Candidatus Doudnabacteria bacterium]
MAEVSTYLNFNRKCEEAFNFYKSVFGGEFVEPGVSRYGEAPPQDGMPPLPEEDKNLVMNVGLKILGDHLIMGSDVSESLGMKLVPGNHMYITLQPDSRADSDRLFAALAEGGTVEIPMQDMFWGDYYGSLTDRFGIGWMINCSSKQ